VGVMMRCILKLAFLLVTISSIGCASVWQPTPEELAKADYGRYPDDYQEIITNYMSKSLFDPYSAVYDDWRGPSKGYVSSISGVYYGYRVCVDINAKNRMGAYVGSSTNLFVINKGRVIKREEVDSFKTGLVNLCNSNYDDKLTFQPAPIKPSKPKLFFGPTIENSQLQEQ
jgi:hypothetical protein